ncbi:MULTISPECIES: YceI family protein [unclassified Novosphingobium]|uniref:YceI family protein n=1 Tax=unclassified Novosphingobium TaxID=2644732 RepID=UPI0025EDAEE4|nr:MULTISPECIES: YceI family protein [unclassified Novosphingobium]HQV04832.1 YceI family protein [Novosphingobium sp.]
MFRPALAALALLGTSAALWAAGSPPGAPDPARVTAGTYKVDPLHTLVGWKVNHLGFNDYFGLFGSVSGSLVLDPADLSAARVAVRIPVRKVITASEGLTGHLLRDAKGGGKPDYFGSRPGDALFVSTKVSPMDDGRSAAIDGNLTLNGVTKPLTILATFSGAGKNPLSGKQTVGFHGAATLKRSDWGLSGDVPLVGDQVSLSITAAFEK